MTILSKEEQKTLLKLVRDTIKEYVTARKLPPLPPLEGGLASENGAFVTLHEHNDLRGCIGHMVGSKPLAETIQEMAVAASTQDPRFPPVRPEELKDIKIEISVLSPMKDIESIEEIEVGKHGVLLEKGFHCGVFLPQVATEQGWDRKTFLEQLCYKAGVTPAALNDPETRYQIFEAEVFGEDEFGNK